MVILLYLGASAFHDVPVLHAGRAGGLTGEAAEAAVDVRDEGIGDRQIAVVDLQDLVNASARRVGFESKNAVCRALLQAQSAVDAGGVQIPGRAIGGSEMGTLFQIRGMGCGAQTRNLPRLRICLGSSAARTERIAATSVGVDPQTST